MCTSFEYRRKGTNIPPFLTFLKYTDEKEKSAEVVSKILNNFKKNQKLLDIGAGNADYLLLILKHLGNPKGLQYYLLEPSKDLINILKNRGSDFPNNSKLEIINSTWEEYNPTQRFDYILASHLYHISKEDYQRDFIKMTSSLIKGGKLIFILRDADDVYEFKKTFGPLLFNEDYVPKILDETLPIFVRIAKKNNLSIKRHKAIACLNIPIDKSEQDTKRIIEFFLSKQWKDIPKEIQLDALDFIKKKEGKFEQIDGILEITKL